MTEVLKGTVRDKVGSRSARILRLQGRIPACIQGSNQPHINLSLSRDQFLAARRHHQHLFDIELDRGAPETTMVRELQWNAFGDQIVHVEFRRVIRGQQTEAEVELVFDGHPKGGILNHLVTHLTVLAIPSLIPDSIEVKVEHMELGDSLAASDLILPEGVSLGVPETLPIAVVVSARGVEEDELGEEGEEETSEGPSSAADSESEG